MPFIPIEDRETVDTIIKEAKSLPDLYRQLQVDTANGKHHNGYVAYLFYIILAKVYGNSECRWEQRANGVKVVDAALDAFKENCVKPYERLKETENGVCP